MRRKLSCSVLKPSVGGNIPRLGQQSLDIEVNLYAKVDPDEDSEAVTELLWQQAKASVKAQAVPVLNGVNYQAQVKRKESWATVSDEDGF